MIQKQSTNVNAACDSDPPLERPRCTCALSLEPSAFNYCQPWCNRYPNKPREVAESPRKGPAPGTKYAPRGAARVTRRKELRTRTDLTDRAAVALAAGGLTVEAKGVGWMRVAAPGGARYILRLTRC